MRDPVQVGLIGIAIAMLVIWVFVTPRGAPPARDDARAPEASAPTEATPPLFSEFPVETAEAELPGSAARPPSAKASQPVTRVELQNDAVSIRVSNRGGRAEAIRLLRYADRVGEGAAPVELVTLAQQGSLVSSFGVPGFEDIPYVVEGRESRRVTMTAARDGVEVRRRLSLDPEGYGGELRLQVRNGGQETVRTRFSVSLLGRERVSDAPDRFHNYALVVSHEGSLERRTVAGIESPGFLGGLFGGSGGEDVYPPPVAWAGVESQYFLLAAVAGDPQKSGASLAPLARDTGVASLSYAPAELPPGHQLERVYRLYFGPKLEDEVVAVDAALSPAVHVGWAWVRPLVALFARALTWSHDHVVANYGVGIILLTLLLRLATYPLTQKSMRSMKRFGEIAPLMKEVQEKHGDDRERMSAEMMKLYKDKGINPFSAMGGGCLPMLIQMPFMIALYFALQGSIELRHAPFALWIQDLSAPEDFFAIAGFPIRPLPLMMGGSMLLQQRLSPQTGDPQQRQMMMWMSVVFTFMFYQFPSGLLLYWFVSNLLGIGQQMLVNRGAAPREQKA